MRRKCIMRAFQGSEWNDSIRKDTTEGNAADMFHTPG